MDELREALERTIRDQGRDHEDVAYALDELAREHQSRGEHGAALPLLERAVAILDGALGTGHPDAANLRTHLAELHLACGRAAAAEALALEALDALRQVLGLDPGEGEPPALDAETRRLVQLIHRESLGLVSAALRAQGRYREALPPCREALRIAEELFDPGDPELAVSLNALGVLHKYRGELGEAGSLYRRARSILERAPGPQELPLAAVLYNLAGLEHARGEFARAEPPCRRALALRERALGPAHPEVAVNRMTLAAILDGMERYG